MPLYFCSPPPCWTCRRHLILSPGAITEVVKIPLNAPAKNSLVLLSCFPGSSSSNFFPTPKPKKEMAKIGATPKLINNDHQIKNILLKLCNQIKKFLKDRKPSELN